MCMAVDVLYGYATADLTLNKEIRYTLLICTQVLIQTKHFEKNISFVPIVSNTSNI